MCKPFKEYLAVVREYTREIITFGGVAASVWIYTDFKQFMTEQVQAYRDVAAQLAEMNARINDLEQWNKAGARK